MLPRESVIEFRILPFFFGVFLSLFIVAVCIPIHSTIQYSIADSLRYGDSETQRMDEKVANPETSAVGPIPPK